MNDCGPKTKNTELTENEEIAIIEAFQEAEEYLETGIIEDDFYFEPED